MPRSSRWKEAMPSSARRSRPECAWSKNPISSVRRERPSTLVVVGFYTEAEGEERGVIDCFAGLDDEVFEEKVEFWGRYFEARDWDVLDGLD